MRASRQWLVLALATWLLGVVLHAAFAAFPSWRVRLDAGQPWMQEFRRGTPAACRILVVGSSPALFGLDARVLQARTGCSALNLAMIGIGDRVDSLLDAVLDSARPGDIVLLSDRRWSAPDTRPQPCSDGQRLRCVLGSLRWVPHLADDWRLLGDAGLQRGASGDLLAYPDLPGDPHPLQELTLEHFDYRLGIIERQVRKIRLAGADPVLVAVPLLTRPAAATQVQMSLDPFALELARRLPDATWVGPWVATDADDFLSEGQHLSARGRQTWSERVAQRVHPARKSASSLQDR
jgi:hypothetical protein